MRPRVTESPLWTAGPEVHCAKGSGHSAGLDSCPGAVRNGAVWPLAPKQGAGGPDTVWGAPASSGPQGTEAHAGVSAGRAGKGASLLGSAQSAGHLAPVPTPPTPFPHNTRPLGTPIPSPAWPLFTQAWVRPLSLVVLVSVPFRGLNTFFLAHRTSGVTAFQLFQQPAG